MKSRMVGRSAKKTSRTCVPEREIAGYAKSLATVGGAYLGSRTNTSPTRARNTGVKHPFVSRPRVLNLHTLSPGGTAGSSPRRKPRLLMQSEFTSPDRQRRERYWFPGSAWEPHGLRALPADHEAEPPRQCGPRQSLGPRRRKNLGGNRSRRCPAGRRA